MIFVAWPDWEARAIDLTGECFLEVKKSVIKKIKKAIKRPTRAGK